MEKPKEINDLEIKLGFVIKKYDESKEYYDDKNEQSFKLDEQGRVVYLKLFGKKISDVSFLHAFKFLTSLDLTNNQLIDISPLKDLILLTELGLSQNQLTDISPLKDLTKLTELYLGSNQLTNISPLKELTLLTKLNLSYNQLTDISPLQDLTLLAVLDLGNNQLTNLPPLKDLTSLFVLYLSYNQLTDISHLKDLTKLTELRLGNNPIENTTIPFKVNENNVAELKLYFASMGKIAFVLPAKILLLGNHAAGKSSLLYKFLKPEEENENKSTHILKIENYTTITKDANEKAMPRAIFFDFGGQDFYHGIYNAFLNKEASTLLLWTINSNDNSEKLDGNQQANRNFNVYYWLYQLYYSFYGRTLMLSNMYKQPINDSTSSTNATALAENQETENNSNHILYLIQNLRNEDATVYYAENSSDEKKINIDKQFNLSLKPEDLKEAGNIDFSFLKANIEKLISSKQLTMQKAKWYINVYTYVLNTTTGKTSTTLKEITTVNKLNAEQENILPEFLNQLHQQGLVLYYKDIDGLKDIVWLEPEKLVEHIHTEILNEQKLNGMKDGIIAKKDFEGVCDCPNLRTLLEKQKVIYLHNNNEYIIPNFLPIVSENNQDYFTLLSLQFTAASFTLKFENFLPFGLINQLICHFADKTKQFWRNRLIVEYKPGQVVMIALDFTDLKIKVYQAHNANNNEYLQSQKELFYEILAQYWDIDTQSETFVNWYYKDDEKQINEDKELNVIGKTPREEIIFSKIKTPAPNDMYLSIDGENFVHHNSLDEAKETMIVTHKIVAKKIDKSVSKEKIINPFLNLSQNTTAKPMKKIFISYSNEDVWYKRELEKHLKPIASLSLAKSWSCEEITPGLWHEQIQNELENSDIIICMLSIDFMNSDYILKEELYKFMMQMKNKPEKRMVCILVKEFSWRNYSKLYELSGLRDFGIKNTESEINEAIGNLADNQFMPYAEEGENEGSKRSLKAVEEWEFKSKAFTDITNKIIALIGSMHIK